MNLATVLAAAAAIACASSPTRTRPREAPARSCPWSLELVDESAGSSRPSSNGAAPGSWGGSASATCCGSGTLT